MKYLLILLFLFSSLQAGDVISIINKLDDEDFEVREAASQELSKLPIETAGMLYNYGNNSKSSEVKERIQIIIHNIFSLNFRSNDDRVKRTQGSLGVDYNSITLLSYRANNKNVDYGFSIKEIFPDSPCDSKLKKWDIIVEINGLSISQQLIIQYNKFGQFNSYGYFIPGVETHLTVLRPVNTDVLEKKGFFDSDDDNPSKYTIEDIIVTPTSFVDAYKEEVINQLESEEWEKFRKDLTKN